MEPIKLQTEIDALISITERMKASVADGEIKLRENLNNMWALKNSFTDELADFHETRGILSPWWNDIRKQTIQCACTTQRQMEVALQLTKSDIDKIKLEISELTMQREIIGSKLSSEEETIVDLKKLENELQQEPFGIEFLSLKAEIEKSHRSCTKLTDKIGKEHEIDRLLDDADDSDVPDGQCSGFVKAKDVYNSNKARHYKIFNVKEKTRIELKRQYSSGNLYDNKGEAADGLSNWQGTESGEQCTEITHD